MESVPEGIPEAPKNELAAVGRMVAELEAMTDGSGRLVWTRMLLNGSADCGATWNLLSRCREARQRPGNSHTKYTELAPIGPLYAHASDEGEIRRVIRRWRVHSPLLGIVDVARFPKFLSTPRHRVECSVGGADIFAEQFLVPGDRPSEWRTAKGATVPMHACDFGSFELPVVQIIILDPWGESAGGSAFLHQMLSRELKNANVDLYESPEAAKSGRPAGGAKGGSMVRGKQRRIYERILEVRLPTGQAACGGNFRLVCGGQREGARGSRFSKGPGRSLVRLSRIWP